MVESDDSEKSAFRVHPDQLRAAREADALNSLTERFADAEPVPGRHVPPHPSAFDAIRAAVARAGSAVPPEVRDVDLLAALTLLPRVRAELDGLEAALLFLARERGMSWSEIAFGMGLGSPQAAQQRSTRTRGTRKGATT